MSYLADSLGNMGTAEEARVATEQARVTIQRQKVAIQRQEVVSLAASNVYGKHTDCIHELMTLMSDQQDKIFHYTQKSLDYENQPGEERRYELCRAMAVAAQYRYDHLNNL